MYLYDFEHDLAKENEECILMEKRICKTAKSPAIVFWGKGIWQSQITERRNHLSSACSEKKTSPQ